jgi:hypothetical protein
VPPVIFWYPSIKITGKERLENGKLKKSYGAPKTPYQRLLESPGLFASVKGDLKRQAMAAAETVGKPCRSQALADS